VNSSLREREEIDVYHCLAPHVKKTYREVGYKSNKLETIPHFYDTKFEFDRTSISNPVRLLYVGKLTKKKGVQLLPTALKRASFDFELLIAGVGSQRESLEREFSKAGLIDQVTFLGYVEHDELPSIYAKSDIFLYPGLWSEPFGRVILESMASDTPVVASDVGSMDWILQDAGVVIPVDKYENRLAAELETLIESYPEYLRNCNKRIQNFSKNKVLDRFEQMYSSIS
jgi:glycosyltransferase involved in cell wall biosynthesis